MRPPLIILAGLLASSLPVAAHHSRANFLMAETTELEGVVSRVNWRNPHVYIDIEVENEDGSQDTWTIETAATMQLQRQGWNRDSLKPGDRIVVSGSPDRNPERPFFFGAKFTFPDGRSLENGVATGEIPRTVIPPADYASLSDALPGVYQYFFPPAPPGVDRFGNRLVAEEGWPLTEKARLIADSYDPNTDNPLLRCLPYVTPYHWRLPYLQQIELTEDSVVFIHEYGYIVRTVPIGIPMPSSADPSYQGTSVARWDGPELVVDTAYYLEHPMGIARGIPGGKLKKTEERFRLTDDGHVEVTITVSDPEHLTEPASRSYTLTRLDSVIEENDCDLEAAQRYARP